MDVSEAEFIERDRSIGISRVKWPGPELKMLGLHVNCPVKRPVIQAEGENAVISGRRQEQFTLINTDSVTIGEIRILPGIEEFETTVVGQ